MSATIIPFPIHRAVPSAPVDDAEFMRLFRALTPDMQSCYIAALRGLAASVGRPA